MPIEVRRAADRFLTEIDGRSTAHSFSFGEHYDPRNLNFGALLAHNDERLEVGAGYEAHLHRDTEIVTWVLSGALEHSDDLGHSAIVHPGQVQVLSAGSGVTHTETNAASVPTRFIQAWLRPDEVDTAPSYSVESVLQQDGWTVLAGEGGVRLGVAGARLYLGQMTDVLALPHASRLHVFVMEGSLAIGEREIRAGAVARMIDEGGRLVEPTMAGTTILVWAMG